MHNIDKSLGIAFSFRCETFIGIGRIIIAMAIPNEASIAQTLPEYTLSKHGRGAQKSFRQSANLCVSPSSNKARSTVAPAVVSRKPASSAAPRVPQTAVSELLRPAVSVKRRNTAVSCHPACRRTRSGHRLTLPPLRPADRGDGATGHGRTSKWGGVTRAGCLPTEPSHSVTVTMDADGVCLCS